MLSRCNHLWKTSKYLSLFARKLIDSDTNVNYGIKQVLWIPYCISTKNTATLSKSKFRHWMTPKSPNILKKDFHSIKNKELNLKNRTTLYYCFAFTAMVSGLTYASVLLYRLYCQTTGKGGAAVMQEASEKIAKMHTVERRTITVNFNADLNSTINWNFKPQQHDIKVFPGETALAFYTAMNPSDKAITGVATYNVMPYEAGKYLNKIQCFCFEEQQLNPHEEVDMPVFFYLDPEFAEDPFLENINQIVLSYCFFEAKEGVELPLPAFMR